MRDVFSSELQSFNGHPPERCTGFAGERKMLCIEVFSSQLLT